MNVEKVSPCSASSLNCCETIRRDLQASTKAASAPTKKATSSKPAAVQQTTGTSDGTKTVRFLFLELAPRSRLIDLTLAFRPRVPGR